MQNRENALNEWLESALGHSMFTLTPLAGDASFRRYFRLNANGTTKIIMDAPPKTEPVSPFISVDEILSKKGILAPKIYAADETSGFLMLQDFGDQLLLKTLHSSTAESYYHQAIDIILKMQQPSLEHYDLPHFNREFMMNEMHLFKTWFLQRYLSIHLDSKEEQRLEDIMDWLVEQIRPQPQAFIHRDYHSRNLMIHENNLAVIDFQDAMYGPVTYDLVSLIKDCYISWPRAQMLKWIAFFHQHSAWLTHYDFDECVRAVDLCGLQRHLKVLGVFCRLHLRDQKSGYLQDLPRALQHAIDCCEIYPELHPLYQLLKKTMPLI